MSRSGQNYTFAVDPFSNTLQFVGDQDLHDQKRDDIAVSSTFEEFEYYITSVRPESDPDPNFRENSDFCRYRFHAFSTAEFEQVYITGRPSLYATISAVIFVFTAVVFILYDVLVRRRQTKIMHSAKQTNDIVSSLFPVNVRDRVLARGAENISSFRHTKGKLADFMNSGNVLDSEPIADTFAEAVSQRLYLLSEPLTLSLLFQTVMFFDVANFTAWSSERHPTQVFRLLEGIYSVFDEISKGMGVFKVETIGDSCMFSSCVRIHHRALSCLDLLQIWLFAGFRHPDLITPSRW